MMKIKKMAGLNYDYIFYIYEYRTYKQIEKKLTGALNIRESPGYKLQLGLGLRLGLG